MAEELRDRPGSVTVQAKDARGRPVPCVFRTTRPDGTEYFRLDLRGRGKRIRVYGGKTLTDARVALGEIRHRLRLGTFETDRERKTREEAEKAAAASSRGLTFGEFCDRFLTDYGSQRRSNYYFQRLRPADPAHPKSKPGPIRAHFADRYLRDISLADLDTYRRVRSGETYQGKSLSASTVRKDLVLLGTMFRQAKRWGLVEVNVAADLEKPREPEPQGRPLTSEEWNTLCERLSPALRSLAVFAISTGARLKEAVGLRWSDVDSRGGYVYFGTDCKTARSKRVRIGEAAKGILEEQDRRRREIARATSAVPEFVFVQDDGKDYTSHRERNRISQHFRVAAKDAGLFKATFKTLRTTAASWAEEDGVPVGETQRLLGHADVRTTQRFYTRSAADRTANVVSVLDRRLLTADRKRTLETVPTASAASAGLDRTR